MSRIGGPKGTSLSAGGRDVRDIGVARLIASLTSVLLVLGPAQLSVAQEGPPEVEDRLRAYSIVPPGQEGDVTAQELITGNYGPHYEDQLRMYSILPDDRDITEGELKKYKFFHSMQFGPHGEVESSYEPTAGVTVYRDSFGIPHIYADTLTNASFALGYVTAEDRMWQMDVFRHAARGELAEFVGPSWLDFDISVRREGYTEEEVQKMFDDLDDKFGADGKAIQEGLQAYADGVNAHIDELKSDRFREMPAEYAATDNPPPQHPEEWSPLDTLYLAILQLRVFGETAGFELTNAGLYAHLKERLGNKLGPKVFEDLIPRNDPRSYTSVPRAEGTFPSQNLGTVKPAAMAIPDAAKEEGAEDARERAMQRRVLAGLGFRAPASNALLVSANNSVTGNPLHIGAPQVGYANPAFFLDIDVHVGDKIHFRGPAVPGASALIPLGRGVDYAWTLTTGFSDAVDVRAEELCEPEGGESTEESNGYMFEGECKAMEERDETFIVKPSPADPGAPDMETHTFYRTVHGPVFERGTVNGKPVAFVRERFFWKRELDSLPPFYRWNTKINSLNDFKSAAAKFTMSFNSLYADAKHIGFFHVGYYPERARGVHPALPVWGTGQWEWGGRIPFARHPQTIDPAQGWVANWNNKPSRGWDSFDAPKFGAIHRVELLSGKMRRLLRGPRKANLSDIVEVIADVATQDTRGVYLGPRMVKWADRSVAGSGVEAVAIRMVRDWIKEGANRENKDYDDFIDDPAVAVFDAWYDALVHKVFDDELGETGYDLLPNAPIFDHDMRFDFSSYLKNLFSRRTRRALARNYCDNVESKTREGCRDVVVTALVEAITKLKEDQGDDPTKWTAPAEWIEFENQGGGSVTHIPWQNRGTHNHVVEVLSDAG